MRITRRSALSTLAGTAAAAALRPRFSVAQANSKAPETSKTQDQPLPYDPLRPTFHYLPARNWMNDPCAPVFHSGQYHMFHQYNPNAGVWGDMHWAHATSPDMVHWKRLPVALAPSATGPDADGCFTGSAFFHNHTPAIIYTGVQAVPLEQATLSDGTHNFRETQLLATSSDPTLSTWTKRPEPVIPSPPPGMKVTGFRDPTPFTHAGAQYLVVGSGVARKGGLALLYRAAELPGGAHDLTHWEYLHPLAEGPPFSPAPPQDTPNQTRSTPIDPPKDPVDTGEMWECPDFFDLDNRHVLIYSTRRKTFWQVGDLDPATLRFHATSTGQLDHGRSFYAPKTQLDAHGNRILWGWLSESRTDAEMAAAGWSGMLSLPRVLTIRNGQLRMSPLPALQQLRTPATAGRIQEFTATAGKRSGSSDSSPFRLTDAAGLLLAIDFTGPDGVVLLDRGNAVAEAIPLALPDPASLHMFFDNSVLELFIGERFAFTERHYKRHPSNPVLRLTLPTGWGITNPHSYALKPIWPV